MHTRQGSQLKRLEHRLTLGVQCLTPDPIWSSTPLLPQATPGLEIDSSSTTRDDQSEAIWHNLFNFSCLESQSWIYPSSLCSPIICHWSSSFKFFLTLSQNKIIPRAMISRLAKRHNISMTLATSFDKHHPEITPSHRITISMNQISLGHANISHRYLLFFSLLI